jgi:5-formyltetrahydrofolate cyclo-ligase
MAVPSPTKSELRARALLERREYARALAPDTRSALEAALARIVLPQLIGARIIGGYHPMRDEISPYAVLDLLGNGQACALPWFGGRDTRMMFRQGPATEPGPWGMLQPSSGAEPMLPDTVLVPLVLADLHGTRIGHGKGHYDRALSYLRDAGPVRTIGIAWDIQLTGAALPADPWDVPLDAIATPKEWIQCK